MGGEEPAEDTGAGEPDTNTATNSSSNASVKEPVAQQSQCDANTEPEQDPDAPSNGQDETELRENGDQKVSEPPGVEHSEPIEHGVADPEPSESPADPETVEEDATPQLAQDAADSKSIEDDAGPMRLQDSAVTQPPGDEEESEPPPDAAAVDRPQDGDQPTDDAATAAESHSGGESAPDPVAPDMEPEQDTPAAEPEQNTLAAEPEPDTPAVEPEQDTPAAEQEPDAPAAEPEQGTPAAEPEQDTPAAEQEPDTPAAEPEQDTPAAEPEQDTSAAEPKSDTPAAEPKPDTPAAEPDQATPAAEEPTDAAEESYAVPPVAPMTGPTLELPVPEPSASPAPAELDDAFSIVVPGAPGDADADGGEGEGGANEGATGDVTVTVPGPSDSPAFRPYSETPVYSEPGLPEPPPETPAPAPAPAPPPPPARDAPCSGDWHRKTVDDLVAMDVPDVRLPRCLGWGPCEIRGWLGRLGLSQYVDALLNNNICGRRLCLLTASNLPRMGITDWEHILTITGSVRELLSVDDYVLYEQTYERPPPGRMTRALYLQCAWPSGQPAPSSQRYGQFLRRHGFLDVLLEMTNRPIVQLPQKPASSLYREIPVASVPSVLSKPSQSDSM
ncbi:cell surface glycoprotein 1-like [Pollicipes pollicipes]|uniref:cell surface glycoprotein 1-like n=1 Tax=Pollicipes pollicipes TaxID=41117 RepID=UPI0018859227|nr:cell surface glycoprotein 1-like [Pollicipes pollicipes]